MKDRKGLEMIAGGVSSGKSEEALRRVRREQIAGLKIQSFKRDFDNRFDPDCVCSRNGDKIECTNIKEEEGIIDKVYYDTKVILVDEVQFFPKKIISELVDLSKNHRVIVTGLDMDFKEDTFLIVTELMGKADKVDKLHAVCVDCGEKASRSLRIIGDRPADKNGEIIQVGKEELYKPVCRHCYDMAYHFDRKLLEETCGKR